ncbi:RNA polymerase sigma factor [Kitasatospora sp. NPDC004289]
MRDRLRAGDRGALAELYDEHAAVLYRYALRVTGDWAEAEDIVSATFLAAWNARESLRTEGGELRPWLLGIATNLIRRNARTRRLRRLALARVPERGLLPDFSDDLVAHLADAEQLRAARAALGRLRPRDREVFVLVVWEGLDYAAAAEALGVPVGTVRSRLSRARDRLRTLTEAELRRPRPAPAACPDSAPADRPGPADRRAAPGGAAAFDRSVASGGATSSGRPACDDGQGPIRGPGSVRRPAAPEDSVTSGCPAPPDATSPVPSADRRHLQESSR